MPAATRLQFARTTTPLAREAVHGAAFDVHGDARMTGRRYYITTLADWQRYAARFANSHWLALDAYAASRELPDVTGREIACATNGEFSNPTSAELSGDTRVLVLIEADEGVHLSLDDDAAFEALPHPLAPKSISDSAQTALAAHGVTPGTTMFEATEIISRAHPLLRHRVF